MNEEAYSNKATDVWKMRGKSYKVWNTYMYKMELSVTLKHYHRFLLSALSVSWPGGWASCLLSPICVAFWAPHGHLSKLSHGFPLTKIQLLIPNTAVVTRFSPPVLSEINFWNTSGESKTWHISLSPRTFSAFTLRCCAWASTSLLL